MQFKPCDPFTHVAQNGGEVVVVVVVVVGPAVVVFVVPVERTPLACTSTMFNGSLGLPRITTADP
jgi:hypothetical protein